MRIATDGAGAPGAMNSGTGNCRGAVGIVASRSPLVVGDGKVALAGEVFSQQPPLQPRDYYVGTPGVGLPVAPPAPGTPPIAFAPASRNVRMFGALYSVEICVYDPGRGVRHFGRDCASCQRFKRRSRSPNG